MINHCDCKTKQSTKLPDRFLLFRLWWSACLLLYRESKTNKRLATLNETQSRFFANISWVSHHLRWLRPLQQNWTKPSSAEQRILKWWTKRCSAASVIDEISIIKINRQDKISCRRPNTFKNCVRFFESLANQKNQLFITTTGCGYCRILWSR